MKKVLLVLSSLALAAVLHSQVIHIPADYPTIQQGINAAFEGDTILVAPGTYQEPISFLGKNITVGSLYLTTNDPAYISQTTIGQVQFDNGEDSTAVLTGFTITNPNQGSGIVFSYSSPTVRHLIITGNHYEEGSGNGGGIYCYYDSSPLLEDLTITGNSAMYGGGICFFYATGPRLKNVTVRNNTAEVGGGICCYYESNPIFSETERCSVYSNSAITGNDLYGETYYWSGMTINIPLDTFSVLYPNDYYADHGPACSFDLDIQHGIIPQLDANLYVSPAGSDSNTGLSAASPFKTLRHAFSRIRADSGNQHTVYLLEGTYSTSLTAEVFPVNVIDFVNLVGSSQNNVILDAEGQPGVLQFKYNDSNILTQVTISGAGGGNSPGILCDHSSPLIQYVKVTGNENIYPESNTGGDGGGICSVNSSPVIEHVTLCNNKAGSGGGIYTGDESSPVLRNVYITNNEATNQSISSWGGYYPQGGGGLFSKSPFLQLEHVVISGNSAIEGGGIRFAADQSGWGGTNTQLKGVNIHGNSAVSGGGIHFSGQSNITFDSLERCNIYHNQAEVGNDLVAESGMISTSDIHVVLDTFSVLYPNEYYAESLSKLTFDIWHGILPQVEADLYVSPLGSNTNSGLNATVPLKTIRYAFSLIRADSLQQHTIHLLPGSYGSSFTGESMPVKVIDYLNIAGVAKEQVILDAEGGSRVMEISGNDSNELSGMTLTGGEVMYESGGGLFVQYSSPYIHHMVIRDNTCTEGSGGGICCWYSEPQFSYVTLSGNETEGSGWSGEGEGGGMYLGWSPAILENVEIKENLASTGSGGGIFCNTSGAELHNVTLKDNSSEGNGGGIFISSSDVQFDNVIISGNTGNDGGGMVVSYSSPEMKRVTFMENHAAGKGGAICFTGYSYPHFDSLDRCNIFNNEAFSGNDLFSYCTDPLHVSLDTFSVLEPTDYYAKPINKFSFDILHGKLNQVDSDVFVSSYSGDDNNSGLTPDDPFRSIRHACRVITGDSLAPHTIHLLANENYNTYNGEFFPVSLPSYVNLAGENNEIHAYGGPYTVYLEDNRGSSLSGLILRGGSEAGIMINRSDPVLDNLLVSNNQGYGLRLQSGSKPVIKNSSINNNNCSGIYCTSSMPVIQQCTIKGNQGRGIWSEYSQPDLLNVTITENQSTGYYSYDYAFYGNYESGSLENVIISNNSSDLGGGMCLFSSFPAMLNVKITENIANRGGGLYASNDYSSRKLNNLTVSGNAALEGGGVYVAGYGGTIRLTNLLLDHNIAQYGGGLYIAPQARVTLSNLTCVENLSNHGGGVFAWNSMPLLMNNSILWNNYPQSLMIDSCYLRISYSDVDGGEAGIESVNSAQVVWYSGNLEVDPVFGGGGSDPYAILATSPCVDAGYYSSAYGIPDLDILGNPRVWDGDGNGHATIDMGAYEYNSTVVGLEEQQPAGKQDDFLACFPNPFEDELKIQYILHMPGRVMVSIFDQVGREVAILENSYRQPGTFLLNFNGQSLQAGVYYCRLKGEAQVMTCKVVKGE